MHPTAKSSEIEGIGPSYAEKLTAASISTTGKSLKACGDKRGRNAANLAVAMKTINGEKSLTRGAVNETVASAWIVQAKTLDPMISH